MITIARPRRAVPTAAPESPATLRARALRSIRAYRRFVRWANDWGDRADAGLIPPDDVDHNGEETVAELNRFQHAAIDAIEAYARATRQRGPHPCVIDERGDVIAYVPALVADATLEFESVFTVFRTARILPR